MRINKYLALSTGMSRRAADTAIAEGRVTVNGNTPSPGQAVQPKDRVLLDGTPVTPTIAHTTIMLNKPTGYVVSRNGQGSPTVYDLLPPRLHHLKPIGRLDKDSSGLLLLTDDGQLAQELTHPSRQKVKAYDVTLNKPLGFKEYTALQKGVTLTDGISHLAVTFAQKHYDTQTLAATYKVRMSEGRKRQIRRTFVTLGYQVTQLHRTHFGDFSLGTLPAGAWMPVKDAAGHHR